MATMFKITKDYANLFCKTCTLICGLLAIILVLHSHLLENYSWVALGFCIEVKDRKECPRVSGGWNFLEFIYMHVVVVICIVLSGLSLPQYLFREKRTETDMCYKAWDFGFHLFSAVSLLVAGILYFKYLGNAWSTLENYYKENEEKKEEFRKAEDVAAGVFVILSALMNGATCLLFF